MMDKKYRAMMLFCLLASLTGCQALSQPDSERSKQPVSLKSDQSELNIAASALKSGDLEVAGSIYRRFTQTNPEQPAGWLGLADTHFLSGELETASKAYATAQQLAPNNIDAYLGQARILLRQRQFTQAIERYQTILTRFPNHPLALSGLGVSHDLTGEHAQAQSIYRRGLKQHPDDAALRTNLGLSLALEGKARESINILLGVNGITNTLPQERDNLALAYGLLGRDDAAEEILTASQPRDIVQDNLTFYRYLRQNLEQSDVKALP
ncbi:tetratricopeptide repeat protein [Brenneria izbisi]|uniref:Tetratricopeptide repeat protein n=1 Tax=Brenneria izbisi TaxID=2939450 RepID=A0AA41XWW2_9GAMM|nr:tetratricopeptide repeat protein [Brenneria izbisi]MCV9878713.1 tetratricopeptide repeat protein [Brenneria izbisi]MCV9882104.1 tetratricopeptide repeat protein [Brenneria izbisi]